MDEMIKDAKTNTKNMHLENLRINHLNVSALAGNLVLQKRRGSPALQWNKLMKEKNLKYEVRIESRIIIMKIERVTLEQEENNKYLGSFIETNGRKR